MKRELAHVYIRYSKLNGHRHVKPAEEIRTYHY